MNYTTTMTVDGQNRDLINYWQEKHICAGDRLLLRLELVAGSTAERTREFALTSYYKRPVSATITSAASYWQLVPHILHDDALGEPGRYDYRANGYWQLAQSFQGRRGLDAGRGARAVYKGAPLQVTFAPVFVRGGASAADVAWAWHDLLGAVDIKLVLPGVVGAGGGAGH